MNTTAAASSSGAAAGLVPSINNGETGDFLLLDPKQLRCTRLRKNLGVAAKILSRCAGQAWMLTFTYARADGWKADHIKSALQHLRKWLRRAHGWILRYIWVMETKKRLSGADIGLDAPHYHVVVWLPRQVQQEELHMDSKGWWPHGMTNAIQAVAPVKYVMKYVSKFDSESAFPKGARIYGVGGLDDIGRRCRRWINWPSFVQDRASVLCNWARAKGGGWLDRNTGEITASEWGICLTSRTSTVVMRLRAYPRTLNPSGPFSWISDAARDSLSHA